MSVVHYRNLAPLERFELAHRVISCGRSGKAPGPGSNPKGYPEGSPMDAPPLHLCGDPYIIVVLEIHIYEIFI